jgi:hypothetical protein
VLCFVFLWVFEMTRKVVSLCVRFRAPLRKYDRPEDVAERQWRY